MRRLAIAFLSAPLILVLGIAPVSADTFPSPGTYFYTSSTTCTAMGGIQSCTDVILSVTPDETGTASACLEIQTYTMSNGRGGALRSAEAGCAPAAPLTLGKDLSVSLAATAVALESCDKKGCAPTRTVIVSASDTPTGAVVTTTTRSTFSDGGCTYRTTATEQSVDLAGTLTTDGSTRVSLAFLQVFSLKTTTNCH